MKYELDILESIIKDTINSSKISKKQFDAYYKTIYKESERIKNEFISKSFSLKKEKQKKAYFQNHQTALIRLTDKVFQKLNQSGIQNIHTEIDGLTNFNLQKLICQQLEDILSFIASNFPKYFNPNDKIPECCRLIFIEELKESINQLENHLIYKENCPLLEIAFYPINKFIRSTKSATFMRLRFLKELIRQINHSCLYCSGNTSHCKLKNKLIHINFNSYRFFSFLTNEITEEYPMENTLCGQIEKLCYHLKEINQIPINSEFIYKPERKSLNEQLITWLIEEITYLEKRQELSNLIVEDSNTSTIKKDFKITTSYSVSQVAFFLKLLVTVGAITNKNQRELLRFFASNMKTRQTEHISSESLRAKYYHIDDTAIEAVKALIINMLNETNKK